MMRRAVLLLLSFAIQNAFAAPVPKPSKEKPPEPPKFTRLIDHLSNPALEELVNLAGVVTLQLENCQGALNRVKMELPPEIQIDAPVNELISMYTPGAPQIKRTFNFARLGAISPSTGILKMAQGEVSPETQDHLNELNEKVSSLLASNSQMEMLGGPAIYSKLDETDDVITLRVIVDKEASEFLIFGPGNCQ